MTVLIDAATKDTSTDATDATGPILVSVVGVLECARVRITADLGSGEAVACTFTNNDPVRIARLEFASGVSFKAYLEGSSTNTEVTVEYIYV